MLDIFSGIGGFSLAAKWCWGNDLEIEAFVEIDAFCQKVLRKNFPGIPIYDDIKKIQWRIQCQDYAQNVRKEISLREDHIVNPAIPKECTNGGKITGRNTEKLQGNGAEKRNMKFLNTMEESASVVENAQKSFLPLTTKRTTEMPKEGNTILRHGKLPSNGDSLMIINSSAITATMPRPIMVNAPIKSERYSRHEKTNGNSPNTNSESSTTGPEGAIFRSPLFSPRPRECVELAGPIDILTAGFPCQPASCAGQRKGTEDDRWLWPEVIRAVREIGPRFCLFENVPGLLTLQDGVVFEGVCADLENEGYEVVPLVIPACAQGAPHRRDRVWICARNALHARSREPRRLSGSEREAISQAGKADCHAPDTTWELLNGTRNTGQGRRGEHPNGHWQEHWYEVATRLCRVDDGLSRRVDRTNQLKALGNSIVPQVVFQIFRAIRITEEER